MKSIYLNNMSSLENYLNKLKDSVHGGDFGKIKKISDLDIKPEYSKSLNSRNDDISIYSYDRMRILITEIKLLNKECEIVYLKLKENVIFDKEEVKKLLSIPEY